MISYLISEFNNAMKENPWLVGAFSLYGMGVLTYMLKYVPTFLKFLKRQCMTTLEFNNASDGNQRQFLAFMAWFLNSKYARYSRYLSLDGTKKNNYISVDDEISYVVGAGYGTHWFIYKKRLFWFEKVALTSSGSDKEKQQIIIKTFGRTQKPIIDLINDFAFKTPDTDISIQSYQDGYWETLSSIIKRDINSVILKSDLKTEILNNLNYFYNNKDWYFKRGLAHKQTYLLHGLPGTGKTSLIKALASYYNKSICLIDLSSMSNKTFEKAMSSIPKNSIVLIEDFDSCKSVHSRDSDDHDSDMFNNEPLTLSKILNVMDGVVSLDGTIVFLTTNHLDKIDSAMVRKGRVDYTYEIPYFTSTEVKEYIKLMYPAVAVPNVVYKDIAGCDIQALFLECKENSTEFLERLSVE